MATEPPGLHLLTIPREIRNLIYEYLTQSVEICGFDKIGNSEAVILLKKAPLMAVLLVCSRLHEEYKEQICLEELSARVIQWPCDKHNHKNLLPTLTPTIETKEQDLIALSHVKILSFFYSHSFRRVPKFDQLAAMLEDLADKMPRLHTLRLAQDTGPHHLCPVNAVLQAIPEKWNTFKLIQIARGVNDVRRISDISKPKRLQCLLALVLTTDISPKHLWAAGQSDVWVIPLRIKIMTNKG